ncbi:6-phosphogluconate dehydrogenase [Leucosporidium creatinivorum]|uniref:Glycerol-3-phosphate dehydrogenase [NAD(+)] n=1 Tax=Leucosporidium creatinivorum TaxID=106004 RepID=A0A1Y2FX67_9BASI|nr:6-phosphogluconate dehydrogenase [Leucosporidium creatinivorum]
MSSDKADTKRVLVLDDGNFGSCLADHLADIDNDVFIHCRKQEVIDSFNTHHRNPNYLQDHIFSKNLTAIGPEVPDLGFVSTCDVLVFAIPTQSMRSVLESLHLDKLDPTRLPQLCFVNKGIEMGTNKLPLEVIEEACGSQVAHVSTFLSGPSFAKEIVKRQPTQVSVSSTSIQHAQATAELFHQPHFRCYVNTDPIGVELAGALKNVYAIASGVSGGLGFEANTRAGLVTRSLAEMTRIGVAYNADPLTFLSLAGVGDLFLTCSSEKSRNFTVGYRLGKGESLEHILETLGSVAEGVDTAKSAYAMVQERNLHAPILEHVYRLLWKGESAKDLAKALMELPMMEEKEGMSS